MHRPLTFARLFAVAIPGLSMGVLGCAVRPPHFVDLLPVTEVADDLPIPMPQPTPFIQALYLSDLYVRTAMVAALDPKHPGVAGDVNAFDEVPRSQWFEPGSAPETHDGPPVPPLVVLAEPADDDQAVASKDARGIRYDLRFDAPDRPGMRSAAAAIASRLVGDMGYITAEVYVADLNRADLTTTSPDVAASLADVLKNSAEKPAGVYRVSATRWPIGVDLGLTPRSETRSDDPNDRIQHRDRRTLRGLKATAAWLGLTRADAGLLRDAYVGAPGKGHVRHVVVGLDGALGSDAVVRANDPEPEGGDRRFLVALFSLGFYPKQTPIPTQTEHPSLGVFEPEASIAAVDTSPPFEPMDRRFRTISLGGKAHCARQSRRHRSRARLRQSRRSRRARTPPSLAPAPARASRRQRVRRRHALRRDRRRRRESRSSGRGGSPRARERDDDPLRDRLTPIRSATRSPRARASARPDPT